MSVLLILVLSNATTTLTSLLDHEKKPKNKKDNIKSILCKKMSKFIKYKQKRNHTQWTQKPCTTTRTHQGAIVLPKNIHQLNP